GKNFSAGADLKWMKSGISQSDDQLRAESYELALLFNKIMHCNSITICALKGKVIGGANGIAAASDIVIATTNTSFAFTEVKLGLIPATIAPYVYRKSKERSMEWMLTGRTISADEALAGGIINHIVDENSLESTSDAILKMILSNGPKALSGVKNLFLSGLIEKHPDDTIKQTSGLIADFRTSSEGLEGLTSFFEKRKPSWMNEN
ncbi:MAG TPA: enoyl-CoA hydratase-related protein, partial [Bacteroidales bacterium]|nr:enoyl-CoA hydratase-related protein [Bacteroidales bacterium]